MDRYWKECKKVWKPGASLTLHELRLTRAARCPLQAASNLAVTETVLNLKQFLLAQNTPVINFSHAYMASFYTFILIICCQSVSLFWKFGKWHYGSQQVAPLDPKPGRAAQRLLRQVWIILQVLQAIGPHSRVIVVLLRSRSSVQSFILLQQSHWLSWSLLRQAGGGRAADPAASLHCKWKGTSDTPTEVYYRHVFKRRFCYQSTYVSNIWWKRGREVYEWYKGAFKHTSFHQTRGTGLCPPGKASPCLCVLSH